MEARSAHFKYDLVKDFQIVIWVGSNPMPLTAWMHGNIQKETDTDIEKNI